MVVVPDASVILKWILPVGNERFVDHALAIREAFAEGDVRLMVPTLWYFEVGNTLARRYPVQARRLLRQLRRIGLEEAAASDTHEASAVRIATTYGVTFYDACYHALAQVHRGVFVTADEKYVARASDAGAMLPLAEWPVE